ncbi:MAG: S8 family serine peptidase [Flavobacteriales bacterium]|nr:S8 family serine peptidase [Flavobacteriales bacterium]
MKKGLIFTLLLAVVHLANAQEAAFLPGQILIQTEKGANLDTQLAQWKQEDMGLESVEIMRCVNRPMGIWQLSFDPDQVHSYDLKRFLAAQPRIFNVQFNHLVQERSTDPDDPYYASQWHHKQANDKDIDSDLAWDITTGGMTAFGDEIVVCVIEGSGSDWEHEDLIDNHWVNVHEIPGDGIDNDYNGFTDDYNGWNPDNSTDDVGAGNHGTRVSSMIGSTGNNDLGVTGVNWDVKIMQCGIGSLNEANVLAAYEYPLVMRQMYNASAGEEGAFVVATNASWGIDYGDPADAPLWCAVYDTLGVHGVLNCGATSNNNVNVDEVGDLPTACGSDYMISVTATNDQDVRTFSGYGQTTIDLAAPGASVYMAQNTDAYGSSSGTSFASPCVAGVIALLYSAPCASLAAIAHADPQTAANMVREAVLDGVDPVDNLTTECVTGGRVNANNSLMIIMDNCSNNECFTPFSVDVDMVGPDDYSVSWGATDAMIAFDLRYRPVGSANWTLIQGVESTSYLILNMDWCVEFEVQVMAHCDDGGSSDWSASVYWLSNGCCTAPHPMSFLVEDIDANSATISWEDILAAQYYNLELSPLGEGTWESYTYYDALALLESLDSCSNYEIQVQSVCDGGTSNFSDPFVFNTPGCGNCSTMEYCVVTGDGSQEWIQRVAIEDIDNTTTTDYGYGDYTDISTELQPGGSYAITLEPGYSGTQWTEYFRVWIDYNVNGEFEDDELAYDPGDLTTTPLYGMIQVPVWAYPGSMRMRVSMDYMGNLSGGSPPEPCENADYGEVEDYCINMSSVVHVDEHLAHAVSLFPNPARDVVTLRWAAAKKVVRMEVFDFTGQLVLDEQGPFGQMEHQLNTTSLTSGSYTIRITDTDGGRVMERLVVTK